MKLPVVLRISPQIAPYVTNTVWLAVASGVPQHLVAIPLAVFIHTRFKGLRNGVVGAYFLPCRPNVMASDLGLPQMDGLALVRASRADAALNGMRCIALSGDAPAESRGRALQAGFDDDWTKPLALELLASEVRQATRNAAARQKGDPPAWASTV